jgi:hypothetical protein
MVQVLKGLFSRSILARAKEKSPRVGLKGVKLLQELGGCMSLEKTLPEI